MKGKKKALMSSISYFHTLKTKLDRDKLIFPEEKISPPLAQSPAEAPFQTLCLIPVLWTNWDTGV